MNKISKLLGYLIHEPKKFVTAGLMRLSPIIPERLYLKWLFRLKMGYRLNLDNPQTFSEKLQWLKLYNRKPEYTQMVDKYAVKEYVASLIGEEYIIPTLGVWERAEDIEWDKLPDKFVLKTTHGGGGCGVVICRDKSSLNRGEVIKKLNRSMKSDIYRTLKEWPYKNVHRRIIAEELLEDKESETGALPDYKFYCFNGVADNVMVCLERQSGDTKFYFFDESWSLLPLNIRGKNAPKDFTLPKPDCIEQMFAIASQLSQNIPFLRVDLYCANGKIYFGEATFIPDSGFDSNLLPETDLNFGSKIDLSII
ncbi:MAG: hypothetical protein LBM63_03740 [Rikenellaceae bacterium]|nr:hypothetical protein [Rikenellaceae bacterium]